MDKSKTILGKKSFSLPRKLWLNSFFLLALLIMLVINIISVRQLQDFKIANDWVLHTYKVINNNNQILINHYNAVAITRSFLLTGDEAFLNSFNQVINQMYTHLNMLKNLTNDNSLQRSRIALMEPMLRERTEILKKAIQSKKEGTLSQTAERNFIYQGQSLTDKITTIMHEIYAVEVLLLNQRNLYLETRTNMIMRFTVLMSAISIGLLLTIIILFNKRLNENMKLTNKLHQSRTLLKGIIDGTNDYIAAVDTDFKYIAFNHAYKEEFKRIFGKKPIVGMSIQKALELAPDDIERVLSLWKRTFNGESFTTIGKFGRKETAGDYEITLNPIYDEQDKLIGASHISRNIAKRIKQERALKVAKEEIENSYTELKKHDAEISLINEMNSALQSSSSLEETTTMIKNYCIQLLPFAKGVLYILNTSHNYLEPVTTWDDPVLKDPVLLPEQCWGLRKGKIYHCFDESKNLPCKHTIINGQLIPCICVPLLAQNNNLGLLYLQIKNASSMSTEDLEHLADINGFLIENIAGHISLAIANMELQDELRIRSIRDALTGLYNRSYLDESLYRDIERAKRKNISIAVIMMDLDYFKNINDAFGHEAGDLVLIEVGKLLKLYTRKSDIVCRYGGEEFLIIFYDANEEETFSRCEEIRIKISEMNIYLGEKLITPITASFGIAMYPQNTEEWNKLITCADQALYESKNKGRNRISFYHH